MSIEQTGCDRRGLFHATHLISFMFSREFAFGHDDLQPVSMTFNDGRNGWGASIIDGMSTMFIMGLDVSYT